MSQFFLGLLWPFTWRGQTKFDVAFPLIFIFVFSVADTCPIVQLYNWPTGVGFCAIAFLILCLIRAMAIRFAVDSDGHCSPSTIGITDLFSIIICLVATVFWLAICNVFLGWKLPN